MNTPAELADRAAEAIRALNHATLPGHDAYEWPADVDAALAALERLAQRLPQTLDQAVAWLEQEHAAHRIGHDTYPNRTAVADEVADLLGHLETAAADAHDLARSLASARAVSSHLTGLTTDPTDTPRADGGHR
jgi:hypothetical protein